MVAFALAFGSSLSWGASDYFAGIRSRRLGALVVAFWAQLTALLLLASIVGVLLLANVVDVRPAPLLLGALAGTFGAVGLMAFYRALALGPMVLIPPIAGSGVVIPVAWDIARGGEPAAITILGAVVAVAGVVLAASGGGGMEDVRAATSRRLSRFALGLALLAAGCFATFQVIMSYAAAGGPNDAFLASGSLRFGGAIIVGVSVLAARTDVRRGMRGIDLVWVTIVGVLDAAANLMFAVAVSLGDLAPIAVLGTLYPAVTSGLAHWLDDERASRLQLAGVVLALAGIVLIASG